MNPYFSIIITAYKHLKYLPLVLDSLHKQEFKNFELIFIDNNSEDGSDLFLKNLKLDFAPFQVIINKENLGLCKAFNQGVKLAKGKYLIDLAPDDEFLPHKLASNYLLLESSKAELLFSDCELIDLNGQSLGLHSDIHPFDYKEIGNYFCDLMEKHRVASPTMVVSRKLFDQLGGYDETLAYEDFDFISRATYYTELVYDSQVLVYKHDAPKNMSSQFKKRKSKMHTSTLQICQKIAQLPLNPNQKKALKTRVLLELQTQLKLFNCRLAYTYCLLLLDLFLNPSPTKS